jgi:hypothetical protein
MSMIQRFICNECQGQLRLFYDQKKEAFGETFFCVHWLSKWLNIPIQIWSKTQMKPYLHFNSNLNNNTYDILFHHDNPLAGHFEPLLCKRHIAGPIVKTIKRL